MKKSFSVLILLSLLLAYVLCGCNTNKTGTEQESGFNDEILAIIEKSSTITSGNLITKTATDSDGNLNVRYYDANNNLVEEYVWDNDKVISHNVMKYTENGMIMSKEQISDDGQSNVVYFYNYDANDVLIGTTESIYSNGLLEKAVNYDADGVKTSYTINNYNTNKLLTRIECFDGDDKLQMYHINEYNESNLIKKHSVYSASERLQEYVVFEYNDTGLQVSEKHYNADGKLVNDYVTEYYESGEKKSSIVYDSNGNIISSEYYQQ